MAGNDYSFLGLTLQFNICFELSAVVFLGVMLAFLWMQYSNTNESTKQFKVLVACVILANLLDIISAITISYSKNVPIWLNRAINVCYFYSDVLLLLQYMRYIRTFIYKGMGKINLIVNKVLFFAYTLLLMINLFVGIVFDFDNDGKYVHGPLYYSVYALSFYFIINSLYLGFKNKRNITSRQFVSIIFFTFVEIIGSAIQILILPTVLINIFAGSVAMIVIMLGLETPDFRRLEIAMEQLRASSEMLAKSKAEAEQAKEEAENANQAKSTFLASMSHEIRTPINGVLGMNAIIMKETNDPKILEYSKSIDSAGNGLLSIINDILDISKIEAGKMEIVPVEYELSNVLSTCYNMVFMRATDKNLELMFENNPTIPNRLVGDEVRIRQIIVNLLTNAIKYTEKGMVFLTADWEHLDDENMMLIISVKDTGIGIKKDDLDKLFDSFTRLDSVKNRNIEGTGLGLQITRQFIDMMGGTIEVSSVYGKGSEFTAKIPQKIASDEKELGDYTTYSHVVTEEADLRKVDKFKCPDGRILVVDDVEMNIKVIKGLLKDTELIIDSATSGEDCLDMIRQHKYDVIFLDHLMPGMDGIETLEKMMDVEVYDKSTPVVMLTANAFTGAKEDYVKKGFSDYLSKPVKEDELRSALRCYLPKNMVEDVYDEVASVEADNKNKDKDETTIVRDYKIKTPETDFEKRFFFLDVKTGMTYCLESEEFYESIIREFRNTSKYEDIQECYDNANLKDYATYVHGVKSSALTIGALEVSDMAKALEVAAKSEDIDYLKAHHYAFMRKYGELLDNLDEVYGAY